MVYSALGPRSDARPAPSQSAPQPAASDRKRVGTRDVPPAGGDEAVQLELVVTRLAVRFPSMSRGDIEIVVRTVEKRFADAKVRDFLSLLIEKAARREIGEGTASPRMELA
ncbi:three-helix bundle dimerization domain-containing protein [Rhodococcus ruber]|uniref:three-helix bundle dimerization domain-containing protein n=1 Tax=Rhodococcus ruber TaxID=1830 RepID=UPI0037842945